jgi:hypothetical protein
MNIKKQVGALFIGVLIINFAAQAQSAESEKEQEKTAFKLGINYNTSLNYYGRTDSLRSSGFFSLAELWFNESFYLNAAPIFISNKIASFDYAGTVASAGYQFNSENKWLGNIYFLKPFYKDNSQLVQSALKAQAGMTLTWLNKAINLTGGGDIKFSDKTDYGATGGIDHIFRLEFEDKSVLVVDPSAYVFAGTQQFTNTYYKQSNFIFFPGFEEQTTQKVKAFNILAYEISAPVIFAKGKFQLLFTPSYIIPQNLIEVEGRPDLSERGKEMFYATIGAKLSF